VNNLESKRRQYGLVERGRQLGWSNVEVIDDDLGRPANGLIRPGFERLLARVCEDSVGMILSVEASRLARTGRERHTLLEFCGIVNCLIADENKIYDPRPTGRTFGAWSEGDHKRDGAVGSPTACRRGQEPEGTSRRAVH
jgi:DNA invertase Pin-like site-specific DNA recombinase